VARLFVDGRGRDRRRPEVAREPRGVSRGSGCGSRGGSDRNLCAAPERAEGGVEGEEAHGREEGEGEGERERGTAVVRYLVWGLGFGV